MNRPVTAAQLNENMYKQFNVKINFEKYTREQLENARNLLRTKTGTVESSANFNELLSNESYQRDKYMLGVLNTKIKEMLGESVLAEKSTSQKQARTMAAAAHDPKFAKKVGIKQKVAKEFNKADTGTKQLSKAMKNKKTNEGSKPDFLDMDKDGNKKETMKKAIADKKVKEAAPTSTKTSSGGHVTKTASGSVHKAGSKGYGNKWDGQTQDQAPAKSKSAKTAAEKQASRANDIKLPAWKGNVTKHSSNKGAEKDDGTGDIAEASHQANTTMKHVKNPTAGEKQAAKDIKPGAKGYSDRAAMLKSADKSGRLKERSDREDDEHGGGPTPWQKPKGGKTTEALKGGQKKLDVNKNGKLEKDDFAKLRAKKKVKESEMRHLAYANFINEGLRTYIAEDEEGKAKAITAAADMVNDFTSWMQRVGNYQTKSMIELSDNIRANFGMQEAETFKQAVGQALEGALNSLTTAREEINNAVAVLAGEAPAEEQMGMDQGIDGMQGDTGMEEPEMDASMDAMNPSAEDEFAASDAAAGGPDTTGRAMREHIEKGNRLMRMLGS